MFFLDLPLVDEEDEIEVLQNSVEMQLDKSLDDPKFPLDYGNAAKKQ
jgi:hypothetical protein